MKSMLWVGTIIGAILGLLHAGIRYRVLLNPGGAAAHARAGCYAVWTLALWLLCGIYVLVLWSISLVAYAIARPFRWRM